MHFLAGLQHQYFVIIGRQLVIAALPSTAPNTMTNSTPGSDAAFFVMRGLSAAPAAVVRAWFHHRAACAGGTTDDAASACINRSRSDRAAATIDSSFS